jgi:hypothetical protein
VRRSCVIAPLEILNGEYRRNWLTNKLVQYFVTESKVQQCDCYMMEKMLTSVNKIRILLILNKVTQCQNGSHVLWFSLVYLTPRSVGHGEDGVSGRAKVKDRQ